MISSIFHAPNGKNSFILSMAAVACITALIPSLSSASTHTSVSTGFDSFIDRYTILEDDTTEALSEYYASLLTRFSHAGKRIQPELSNFFRLGNQTLDEKLNMRIRTGDPGFRAELTGFMYIKHFLESGDYSFSNDYRQFNANLRLSRDIDDDIRISSKTRAEFVDYDEHSEFDYDYNYIDTGIELSGGNILDNMFRLSAAAGTSEASDTTELNYNRGIVGLDAYISSGSSVTWEVWASGERRKYSGDTRSSSWMALYYSRLKLRGGDDLEYSFNLDGEYISYDNQTETFFDTHFIRAGVSVSSRIEGKGRISFHPRLARMICEDFEEERYREFSLVAGYEIMTENGLWFSLSYEPGLRDYLEEGSGIYSDFYINRVSLMGSFPFGDGFSTNLFLIHDPETHTRREDDFSITLISLSLTKDF